MNSSPYYPSPDPLHHSLLLSSRAVLDQACTPSLNEILGAYKYSKGQDGDSQLLIAVLNAKSAEDQRLAAVAKLHATMLELQHSQRAPSPSSSHTFPHVPPVSSPPPHRPPYAHSSYVRSESDPYERKGKRSSGSWHHHSRGPYERPTVHPQGWSHGRRSRTNTQELPPSPYSSRASDSPASSPTAREAMAIDSLLSPSRDSREEAS